MATDPICGMNVDEKESRLISRKDGRDYYFCSTTCKLQFEKPEKEMHNLRMALLVSWPITALIVILTYIIHFQYADYVMFVLASVVQFYSGKRFYAGIIDAVKNKSSNMDTLIAIGTTAAWAYSTVVIFLPFVFPTKSIYFDTSTIIISLILTGTYMQRLAESRATNAVSSLVSMQPKNAHMLKNGKSKDIAIEEIRKGNILLVRPGERIPTDAVITEGKSSIDESMITGESMPVTRKAGDNVIGGTVNTGGFLRIKAVNVGEDTALSQIIHIVQDAASSKVPVQRLADKVSSYFVPTVVLIGIMASILWYAIASVGLNISVLVFVSVLIVACPCALGIATPAALLVSSGMAAKRGILVKSGESLQTASKVNCIVLDKTGTLTKGKPEVTDIIPFSNMGKREIIGLAAIAERGSEHVIGKTIISKANSYGIKEELPKRFTYKQGSGIIAYDRKNKKITVGNGDMFDKRHIIKFDKKLRELEHSGKTVLIVGLNDQPMGIIALADVLKDDSRNAISALRKEGYELWLVTGDNASVAKGIAKSLGIKNVVSEAKPKDKLEKIISLQKEGKTVAMIGDGVNDAPALTKADLGIAIGAGTEVAMQAGGIILIKNSIYDAYAALQLGKKTMGKIKQNLSWAFGYNAVLIPIAAGALVPIFTISMYSILPMLAALAMAFSSVTVVSNSLLLATFKPRM